MRGLLGLHNLSAARRGAAATPRVRRPDVLPGKAGIPVRRLNPNPGPRFPSPKKTRLVPLLEGRRLPTFVRDLSYQVVHRETRALGKMLVRGVPLPSGERRRSLEGGAGR